MNDNAPRVRLLASCATKILTYATVDCAKYESDFNSIISRLGPNIQLWLFHITSKTPAFNA